MIMKKIDLLFRITSMSLILFLGTLQLTHANQHLIAEIDKDIYFFENGEKIFPRVDYSRIYIVFSEEFYSQTMDQISTKIPALTPISKNETGFSAGRSASFQLIAEDVSEARHILQSIRELKGIESAYPFLLLAKELASLNGQVLVNISNDELANFLKETNTSQIIEKIDLGNSTSLLYKIPASKDLFDFAAAMSASAKVNYAQPDFVFRGVSHFDPDDPYFSSQWFLKQSNDADIDADEAWEITQGAGASVVAVIDGNGFDLLQAEMATKYIAPYCAVNDNNDPSAAHPDENHGTPCAGLIGALTNNGTGVASVGYYCKVMPIRIGHNFNGGSFQTSSSIIQRAAQHVTSATYNIYAVSNSIGLGTWANIISVRDAYESMRTQTRDGKGSVILASTGNDNANSQEQYPCFFPNVVGVGASNSSDQRAYFSNYGDSCDIIAPGLDLWTLDRSGIEGYIIGDYYQFSGTSAACPVAAGVVGLMGTVFTNYTEGQLRSKLFTSCEKVGGYAYGNNAAYPFGTWNNEMGYGRINALLAVQGSSQLDPPTNLQASVNGSNVNLSWDAPSGGGGGTEELIYDNNTVTGSYYWVGNTMATRMSPSGPCKILNISYYTTGNGSFNAEIYGWNGSQPNTSTIYSTSASAANNDWVSLDITGSNITVNGDFVVGYGSTSETNSLGYDENLNNGRSWDFSGGSWSSWTEAYLIRSEVEYTDGSREKLLAVALPPPSGVAAPEEKDNDFRQGISKSQPIPNQSSFFRELLGYNIYRNGIKINSSIVTATTYGDNGLAGGTYNYSVTAVYNAGESNPAGPVEVVVQGSSLAAPTNLQASNNNQNVNLSWTAPAGGNDEWISYNDGSFENSFASTNGGQGLAQQFTLPEVPSTLKEVRFYVADYENYWADIDVYILSGDGNTVLHGPTTVAGLANDWVSISIPDLLINQSTFMVATYNVNAGGPFVGVDEDNYNGGLYFGSQSAGFTEMSEYDYYYVGSHEAYIEYSNGDAVLNNRTIKPHSASLSPGDLETSGDHQFKSNPKPADRGFLYYKIYRNGTYINNTSQTSYADVLPSPGTYAYTVTAYYDEGESDPAGPASVTWSGGGSTVTVSGLVKDAVNGSPVEGALISIAGRSDYSDTQGNYSISDVPAGALNADFSATPEWGVVPLTVQFTDLSGYGNQSLSCSKAGYTTYEDDHVSVPPGAPLTYNISLSPQLAAGEMRFVLNWGASPPDLDIHLLTPSIEGNTYHVYWDDMGHADQPPYATLDNDEIGGFGPETITIVQMFDGTYRVYVLQYDEDAPIAGCGAMVKIYNDNGLLQTVNVPQTGPNDYYYWYICDVNGANGSVSVKNILMNQAPGFADFVFPGKEKNKFVMNGQENNLASWNWDFGDGVTDNQQNPVHIYTSVGTYNVSLTYSDGAGQVSEVKNAYITVGEQSIGENELSSLTRLWPNPARETVSVSCPVRIDHISLFDMNGQMLMQFECNDRQIRLDLTDVLPGMYHLLLDTEKGKVASRLIVR